MKSAPSPVRPAFACLTIAATVLVGAPAASAVLPVSGTSAQIQVQKQGDIQPEATSPLSYRFGQILAALEGKELETTFLAAIIPHHQAAIDMAEMELERGADNHIRSHARDIIKGQQEQIELFTRWLEQWYGLTPEQAAAQASPEAREVMAAMDQEMQAQMKQLAEVADGEAFDVEFVRLMIPHHTGGIIEFLEPQSRAVHAKLRDESSSGIATQEKEIVDFRQWLTGNAGRN